MFSLRGKSLRRGGEDSLTSGINIKDLTRIKYIKEYGIDHDSNSEPEDDKLKKEESEIHAQLDYWIVLKGLKFLKIGDQTACTAGLSVLLTYDLMSPNIISALSEHDTLSCLVNLAESNHTECRHRSLKVIAQVSKNKKVAKKLVDLGICPVVVKRLMECELDIIWNSARIISNVAWIPKASPDLRTHRAIEILVTHMNLSKEILVTEEVKLSKDEKENIKVAVEACGALWVMSNFSENKSRMMETGLIKYLSMILLSGNRVVSTPLYGILSSCATEPMFQCAIETEGLVGVLVKDLQTEDPEMQKLCALALSRAAGDNDTVREMIRFHRGPSVIMGLLMETDMSNHRMLTAALTAMWKSALNTDIAEEYQRLGAADLLVELLNDTDMDVLIAAVGAIGEIAKCDEARLQFISKGAMTEIIKLLGHINVELLVNSARAVGILSDCDEGIAMLDESDGLRLLWSLLKNKSQKVKVEALWAVKPCVTRHPDSGELIRSLMDSLNLLVKMIKQEKNREVLTAVAAVISQVAMDLENLGVMTEQGVVKHLSALVLREPRDAQIEEAEKLERRSTGLWFKVVNIRTKLHCELSSAVANCATLPENRRAFGCAGVIRVIVDYMHTQNAELLAQACRALHVLSQDNFNCVSIQSCGAVPLLLIAIESKCMVTQIGAAGTLKNIRLMLERSDAKRMVFDCMPRDERQKKLKEIEAIVHVISGHHEPDEHKDLILKGHPRSSIDATHLLLNKLHGKAPSEHAIHSFMKKQQQEAALVKKQGSFLSWRERLSLMSLVDRNEKKDFRRSSERSFILSTAAATEKLPKVVIKTRRFSN